MSPDDPVPDDSICAQCGNPLPDNYADDPESWPFEGFCDAKCGLANGIGFVLEHWTYPDHHPARVTIKRAMAELFPDVPAEPKGKPC